MKRSCMAFVDKRDFTVASSVIIRFMRRVPSLKYLEYFLGFRINSVPPYERSLVKKFRPLLLVVCFIELTSNTILYL